MLSLEAEEGKPRLVLTVGLGLLLAKLPPLGALLAGQESRVQSVTLVIAYTLLHDPEP